MRGTGRHSRKCESWGEPQTESARGDDDEPRWDDVKPRLMGAQFRRFFAATGALCALIGAAGGAPQAGPLDGWSSDDVTHVATLSIPKAGGAHRVGNHLFVLASDAVHVVDISDLLAPRVVGKLPAPPGEVYEYDDPDGTADILIAIRQRFETLVPFASQAAGTTRRRAPGLLHPGATAVVIDIGDPGNPRVRSELAYDGDNNLSCLSGCKWAYGNRGTIIDLRDPDDPKISTRSWRARLRGKPTVPGFSRCGIPARPGCLVAHDVTEVAPGRVLTASDPMYLLDTTKPTRPRVLGESDGSPYSQGGVEWPQQGASPFIMSFQIGYGVAPRNCRAAAALDGTTLAVGFKVWDAGAGKSSRVFTGLDEYHAKDGTWTDGNPPASSMGTDTESGSGCAPGFFGVHPSFDDRGGTVALAYRGNGTKFLDVDSRGHVRETGFWLPPPPATAHAAYWITPNIVYVIDRDRGIDVLRYASEAD